MSSPSFESPWKFSLSALIPEVGDVASLLPNFPFLYYVDGCCEISSLVWLSIWFNIIAMLMGCCELNLIALFNYLIVLSLIYY